MEIVYWTEVRRGGVSPGESLFAYVCLMPAPRFDTVRALARYSSTVHLVGQEQGPILDTPDLAHPRISWSGLPKALEYRSPNGGKISEFMRFPALE